MPNKNSMANIQRHGQYRGFQVRFNRPRIFGKEISACFAYSKHKDRKGAALAAAMRYRDAIVRVIQVHEMRNVIVSKPKKK